MKQVTLITDGACVNNPGPGGWACILRYGDFSKEFAGSVEQATNNRMELQAAIEGLKQLREPCEVLIVSDSQYVLWGLKSRYRHAVRGWIRRRKGQIVPVPNADLWQEFNQVAEAHTITGQWVKGHSGDPDNERCNDLAEAQALLKASEQSFPKHLHDSEKRQLHNPNLIGDAARSSTMISATNVDGRLKMNRQSDGWITGPADQLALSSPQKKRERISMHTNDANLEARRLLAMTLDPESEVEIEPEQRPRPQYDLTDEGGLPLTGNPPYWQHLSSGRAYKKPKKRVPRRIRSGK
jgi:ribonuclease HI